MLLSFRPLISVSVLTLLSWCWYSFRRRRTTVPLWPKENVCCSDRSSPVDPSPADSSILRESDLNMDHIVSSSSEIKTLTSAISKIGLTKGVRPEPEGEVSVRFPETLLTEQEKDNIAGEGHPDCGEVSEDDSWLESDPLCLSSNCLPIDSHTLTEQQSGPVSLDSHDGSSLSDLSPDRGLNQENIEKISSVLVQQVIDAAAEDWKTQEPSEPHQLPSISKPPEGGFLYAALESFSVDDDSRVSLQDVGSFREKLLSHLGASVGDDSGCGSCFSEDAPGVEGLTRELSEEGQGFLMNPKEADTVSIESKMTPSMLGVTEGEDEALRGSDVKSCISAATQVSSLAPPPTPPIIFWDIEVPAHLVGRLIGKQGKFMNFLKQSSGAKIYVSILPFTQEIQICHIQGTQQQVDDALSLIRKKFKDLDLTNCVPLPCLPITSWLLLPQDVFVEVMVSRVEAGHHLFVQQHKHPSYQALSTLIQHMQLCYSQPGCPSLPIPVEVGVVCAAPVTGSGWQRAQVIQYDRESGLAHIRYVDDGGYDSVNSATLRQIRSDFVTLPFQAAEVLLDNITPLPGEEEFSLEAKTALKELTANMALTIKVTGSHDGLPLVHMWKQTEDEVVLVNRLLAERGFCAWFEMQ
ncbi:A-kinase anchor protein 1, mitochondrial-like isoform X1 [Carassius auratus]|uniref:A-kinase anchor protein 1, mitochondrial-like isoform X1 n=1 Tax=Carassius auratus TaxID=7957 RepID=A0A6P6KX50_CARAU|nr:A-kinase anchor protein 1, mitochondrial-like isoform X1 [Carassius auratus]XP_026075863.1 A-kinase anchor protein 1, mitochondrial-like isoform X1 [Carassius auratus]